MWRQVHAEASPGDPPVVESMHFRGDTFGLGEKERKESGAEGNSKENINHISALEGARIPRKKKRGKEWAGSGMGDRRVAQVLKEDKGLKRGERKELQRQC